MSCPPICSTSCISSCAPSCCYSPAPAPPPCVATPVNPCPSPQAATPTQPPQKSKVGAKRPASKCSPSMGTCLPAPLYPFAPPAYPPPPPCVPTLANNWCRSNVIAKPLAVNRFVRKPVTYRYPLRPYRSNMRRMVSARPVSRAVLPVPRSFNPCMQPPCPPMMMPPPPPPPQPMMMMPQFPMPPVIH